MEELKNKEFKLLLDWLFSLNAYEFTLLANTIGYILSPFLTTDEQNSLGNFFILIGQILLTVNAQNFNLERNNRN